jgi:hypothetical protein
MNNRIEALHSIDSRGLSYPSSGASATPRGGSGARRIPLDVAFREILALVKDGLERNGEQWNDGARQNAVSTILIAAAKQGWLTVWERGEAA